MGVKGNRAGLQARVGLAVGTLIASLAMVVAPAQGDSAAVPDGSAPDRAAASCWEIIKAYPGSPSGGYWLQTPQLIAPQQFYCDMTTDGGGWVMIGRGRQGWDWKYTGQGDPASIVSAPSGPSAFTPTALPAETVDALLAGQRLDALPDGIRLNRARNSAGTQWQRVGLRPQNRATWTWSFGGGIRTSQTTVDNRSWGAGTTMNWSADAYYNRLTTTDLASKGYQMGFGYGPYVYGSSRATDYLWERTNEGYATPFTQVFIRPQVTSPDFGQIPAEGLPASAQRPMMGNTTAPVSQPWGVTGRVGVNPADKNEANMEVQDIAFIGDTAYVGGMFEFVQKGANPAPDEKIRQPYLAAFDITTGAWKSDFRPQLNGSVWSLAALPDGRLVVGGDFGSVAGQPDTSHLVALDPQTGAVDPNWTVNAYVAADGSGRVRTLDVQDGWLYIGGRFNRLGGGTNLGTPVTLSNLGRARISDGTVDPTWKPHLDATPYELDASAAGDRVYLVGNFSKVNFTAKARLAAVNTTDGALVPGLGNLQPSLSGGVPTPATYQQTVLEVGENVFVGGSEHILTRYDRADFTPGRSVITKNGGDFQALAEKDGVLYGACHCGHYQYWDTRNFATPQSEAADLTSILFIGAWDAQTGEPLPQFQPQQLDGRNGSGPWAMRFDPNGCLWFGGDFVLGSRQRDGRRQWLGGFGKMCPRDSTAPTAPTGLTAKATGGGVQLKWAAGADEAGPVRYEVLRDDRVIATTDTTGYTDTSGQPPARYWVRSIDRAGNRSATTTAVEALAPDTTAPGQVTGLTSTGGTARSASLTWQPAEDDRGVTGYEVLRDAVTVATVTETGYVDDSLTPGTTYSYQVVALDAAGNRGQASDALTVTTSGGVTTVATETFDGPDAPAWPAQWSPALVNGTADTLAEAGRLTVTNTAGAAARATLTDQPRTDTEVLFSWQPDQATSGSYFTVHLRGSGAWQNAYRPRNGYGLQLAPNATAVQLQKNVNGSVSTLGTLSRPAGAGKQWVRFRAVGDTVQAKIWNDGDTEPATWSITVVDDSVPGPGQLHLALVRSGAATADRTVTVDDLVLTEQLS